MNVGGLRPHSALSADHLLHRAFFHFSPHFQNDDFTVFSALDFGSVAMFQYGAHRLNYIVRQRLFTSARIPAKQEQICFICQDPPVM